MGCTESMPADRPCAKTEAPAPIAATPTGLPVAAETAAPGEDSMASVLDTTQNSSMLSAKGDDEDEKRVVVVLTMTPPSPRAIEPPLQLPKLLKGFRTPQKNGASKFSEPRVRPKTPPARERPVLMAPLIASRRRSLDVPRIAIDTREFESAPVLRRGVPRQESGFLTVPEAF
eukprot:TRINITY_DN537_c3_g1_i1.p2 TRINITY_DN537_c3_g1~~TRINITY_DN537_c3_g1_i1.p2  ORF type:complete len:173 (+),score=34.96 TRINITY_DN537_c3_g1_i1:42-560(+)